MSPWWTALAVVAGLGLAYALGWLARWWVRLPPAPDVAPVVVDDAPVCAYCAARATHVTPTIRHTRPLLDGLYRRLGVVPVAAWELDLEPGLAPCDVCALHYHRARSLLEVELGELPRSYAQWVDAQTRHLIRYQSAGLTARLEADARPDVATVARAMRGQGQAANEDDGPITGSVRKAKGR